MTLHQERTRLTGTMQITDGAFPNRWRGQKGAGDGDRAQAMRAIASVKHRVIPTTDRTTHEIQLRFWHKPSMLKLIVPQADSAGFVPRSNSPPRTAAPSNWSVGSSRCPTRNFRKRGNRTATRWHRLGASKSPKTPFCLMSDKRCDVHGARTVRPSASSASVTTISHRIRSAVPLARPPGHR